MSWDVVIADAAGAPDDSSAIFDHGQPLGTAAEVRSKVSLSLPDTDWSDPYWGVLQGDSFTIELNIGRDEIVSSMMLHVRGSGDPLPTIARLCSAHSWLALDTTTGERLDLDRPSPGGWKAFMAHRERFARAAAAEIIPEQLPMSDLQVRDGNLCYRSGKPGQRLHPLADIDTLEIRTATSWGGVAYSLSLIAAGIAAWTLLGTPWLRWPLAIILSGVGLLMTLGVRSPRLFLAAGDTRHAYWLYGPLQQIAAFTIYLDSTHQAERPHAKPVNKGVEG